MARGSTVTQVQNSTIPIPPKDTQVFAKKDSITLYWERTKTTDVGMIVQYADDNKITRPFKAGDNVGFATGNTQENNYGVWVEVTVRVWKKRLFDSVRENATAYYLREDDPVKWEGYESAKALEETIVKQKSGTGDAPAPSGEKQDNTLLYVGVGLAALLLLTKSSSNK